jgi:hypothetical protein
VYMHPRLASKTVFNELYRDRKWLQASAWGFANQLSIHILGIATSGVFDRFPGVQLAFGHMGEHVSCINPIVPSHNMCLHVHSDPLRPVANRP